MSISSGRLALAKTEASVTYAEILRPLESLQLTGHQGTRKYLLNKSSSRVEN